MYERHFWTKFREPLLDFNICVFDMLRHEKKLT